jgi:hypothetical protein
MLQRKHNTLFPSATNLKQSGKIKFISFLGMFALTFLFVLGSGETTVFGQKTTSMTIQLPGKSPVTINAERTKSGLILTNEEAGRFDVELNPDGSIARMIHQKSGDVITPRLGVNENGKLAIKGFSITRKTDTTAGESTESTLEDGFDDGFYYDEFENGLDAPRTADCRVEASAASALGATALVACTFSSIDHCVQATTAAAAAMAAWVICMNKNKPPPKT